MLSPDLQRIKHIRDYCVEVEWGRLLVTETPLTSLIMTPTISALFRSAFCRLVNSAAVCRRGIVKKPPNMFSGGPIKGMRNLIAHNYGSMSRDIIWETASVDIPALKNFCEEQLSIAEL